MIAEYHQQVLDFPIPLRLTQLYLIPLHLTQLHLIPNILCLHFIFHFLANIDSFSLEFFKTLNAREGPWQNPMCVFKPCSKAMSFWHWLHLKKFPIPPLHLSAGWASKQQFVEFDVSRGVCLCILTANARLKLWAFQKCSHTATAQAGKMWNCPPLLLGKHRHQAIRKESCLDVRKVVKNEKR